MIPTIISPLFAEKFFISLKESAEKARKAFEGSAYHEEGRPPESTFNRWQVHNPTFLQSLHHSRLITDMAERVFPEPVKPSYCFLSIYGPEGICPGHTDRPQCVYTIDLCVSQSRPWPIYVGEDADDKIGKPYILKENEALCYSGTGQWHYRERVQEGNLVTMAFFHFVPAEYFGDLN